MSKCRYSGMDAGILRPRMANLKPPQMLNMAEKHNHSLVQEAVQCLNAGVALESSPGEKPSWEEFAAFMQDAWAMPIADARSPDEIIGYNAHGLFDWSAGHYDTSAIIAILFHEAEASTFFEKIRKAEPVWLSSVSKVETMMVLTSRFNDLAVPKFAGFCDMLSVRIAPIDNELADLAIAAFLRFGKGRHPAGLNFGDCFSYALAKQLAAPLLFKGNDFSRTDISWAIR